MLLILGLFFRSHLGRTPDEGQDEVLGNGAERNTRMAKPHCGREMLWPNNTTEKITDAGTEGRK